MSLPKKPRHANQRALTVNTKRVNPNPQPARVRAPILDDLSEDGIEYGSPNRLSDNYHLMLTGCSRAGAFFG